MSKKFTNLLIIVFSLLILASNVSAQGASFKLTQPQGLGIEVKPGSTPYAETIVETIVGNIIGIFFAVGGIGVIIYFVWGTVDWILSGGDKEKISSARKKMTHAIVGLILLSLSYVMINIIGQIVGFNPIGYLQLRYLGSEGNPTINQ